MAEKTRHPPGFISTGISLVVAVDEWLDQPLPYEYTTWSLNICPPMAAEGLNILMVSTLKRNRTPPMPDPPDFSPLRR